MNEREIVLWLGNEPITEEEMHELIGEFPVEDVSADGGGQLTEVGPPYDGSGGVVRGTERWVEEDHPRRRLVRDRLLALLHPRRSERE